jgi:hypothetical protein
MVDGWLAARRFTGRRAGSSRALLFASVIAVGVASALTATASASSNSGSAQPDPADQAWRQLAAISTTDANAAASTLVTSVLPATRSEPTRVAFLTELAGRVGADRLGDIADRNHDGRDDDGLVSLRLPSGQLAVCLELTGYADGHAWQAAPTSLSRCP